MKTSMARHQFRTQMNKVRQYSQSFRMYTPLSMMMAALNFGKRGLTGLIDMFKFAAVQGPFAGLNRGQLRRMSFLFCMYPC